METNFVHNGPTILDGVYALLTAVVVLGFIIGARRAADLWLSKAKWWPGVREQFQTFRDAKIWRSIDRGEDE